MTNMKEEKPCLESSFYWPIIWPAFYIFIHFFNLLLPKVHADMLVLLIFYVQRTILDHLHAGI